MKLEDDEGNIHKLIFNIFNDFSDSPKILIRLQKRAWDRGESEFGYKGIFLNVMVNKSTLVWYTINFQRTNTHVLWFSLLDANINQELEVPTEFYATFV